MNKVDVRIDVISSILTAIVVFILYKIFDLSIYFVEGALGYLLVKLMIIAIKQIKKVRSRKTKDA